MNKLLFFLFFTSVLFAQNDTIKVPEQTLSVIGLDRMNVVYRGVPNPISIAVNNAKSYKITGNGVSQNEDGKYVIRPESGSETKVYVEIEKLDGSKVVEEHLFRIKGLPSGFVTLDGYGCNQKCVVELSKEEIQDAKIDYEMPDFLFDYKIKVFQFEVILIDNKNNKIGENITIQGNKIDKKAYSEIINAKNISFLIIKDVHFEMEGLDLYICKIPPIKVLISN